MIHRIQRWLTVFSIALLCITSFSVSAQELPEPEPAPKIQVTSQIAYVAPGTDGVTTDIHVLETLDQLGFIDHDNDPTTPRVIDTDDYTITNITNTLGVNEIDPMYSPGGSLILYRQETIPDIFSLFVVGNDGQNNAQITPNGVNVFYGTFSPDGTQVAFSAQWGSSQYKIYRSDIDGENQFTLTPGEGFNAGFPLWRENASGAEEIAYIRIEGGASQIVGINPLTAEVLWSTVSLNQSWILQPLYGEYGTFIQREDSESDWEVATINLETREVTRLTDNTTNDCCVVWSTEGGLARWFLEGGALPEGTLLNPPAEGSYRLVAQNSDSGETVPLTETTTADFCAAWWDGTPITEFDQVLFWSDINTGETVPLTVNATDAFCEAWSVDGVVTTDMAALGSLPAYYDFDDFSLVAQNTTSGETVPLTETTTADLCAPYMDDTDYSNWRLVAQNSDTGETVQLTEDATNAFCEAWSVDGVITTDMAAMAALGSSPAYYLSDTEDGGRDIYSVNLDGTNPVNLTANDNREYTSVLTGTLYDSTLLVGWNEIEGDRTVPRLGFSWNISSRYSDEAYELLFLTNGSDPDVVDPISLVQLEQMAADGLVQACAFTFVVGEEREYANKVYTEPRDSAPVLRSLISGETVQANGLLRAGLSITADWLHLTDGTWVKATDLVPPDDCPALPTINRYTL